MSLKGNLQTKDKSYSNLSEILEEYKDLHSHLPVAIITDRHIDHFWGRTIRHVFNSSSCSTIWVGPPGEELKQLSYVEDCITELLKNNFHRKGRILAIGGGAVSDFAGTVAVLINRGVPWDVIPTTLLSMVDASIGGKVGVNLSIGKNLVGHFYPPQTRGMCSALLETLPLDDYKSGLGEVIKYCFLSVEVNQMVLKQRPLSEIISACSHYKYELVRRDFYEKHERKYLNLGHTFGHALEKQLKIPHGVAVLLGIEIVFNHIQNNSSFLDHLNTLKEILCVDVSLRDFSGHLDKDILMDLLKVDKKRVSETELEMVLCDEIGHPYLKKIDFYQLEQICQRFI